MSVCVCVCVCVCFTTMTGTTISLYVIGERRTENVLAPRQRSKPAYWITDREQRRLIVVEQLAVVVYCGSVLFPVLIACKPCNRSNACAKFSDVGVASLQYQVYIHFKVSRLKCSIYNKQILLVSTTYLSSHDVVELVQNLQLFG